MLVGIDARMLGWSGIGRYSQNLIRAIYEYGSNDVDSIKPFLFYNADCENDDLVKMSVDKEMVDVPVLSLFAAKQLANKIGDREMDVFHSPHFVLPAGMPSYPFVITIHDLIPLIVNAAMPNVLHRQLYYQLNKLNSRKAARIIAPSLNTKQDIEKIFNIPEDKIDVVYCAPDEMFKKVSEKEIENAKEKYAINGSYLFALGNQKPNKGLECLIDAFGKLKKERLIEQKLILTGEPDVRFNGVQRRIIHNDLKDQVVFIGKVTDEDLIALYNGATAFMFPSLYEGFGLPPLEAMICETPVVTSNLSSVPEVVGDAAITVDPRQIGDLADAIHRVVTDSDLVGQLVDKGLKRFREFTMERFAAGTIAVYRKALSK